MSFLKRAELYIMRKKARSLILLLILFLMSVFVLIGLALKGGVDKEAEALRKSLGSSFNLKVDVNNLDLYESMEEDGISYQIYRGPVITETMIEKIAGIDGITEYSSDIKEAAWTSLTLKPGLNAELDKDFEKYPDGDYHITREQNQVFMSVVTVWPCVSGDLHENFRMGALAISQGRNIQSNDRFAAVISTELAEKNHVTVGDTFTLETKEGIYMPSDEPFKTLGKPMELEIVGLFEIRFQQEGGYRLGENQFISNLVYTDMDTGLQIRENRGGDSEREYYKVTFFVDDPQNLENVLQRVKNLEEMDPNDYILELDDSAYRASMRPLKQINLLAMVLLAAGTIGCMLILYLILKIWTKERKKEVGILLSVGVKRRNILLQMISECIVLTVLALLLTFLLSGVVIRGVSSIAESATAPSGTEQSYTVRMEATSIDPIIDKVSGEAVHLNLTVTFPLILIISLTGCTVTVVSVLLAAVRIINEPPKRLL